jgi:hypothetical protein
LADFADNPNKPVVDRIVTTFFAALRDEAGASHMKSLIAQYPHFVTQTLLEVQGLLCHIQSFVLSIADDFDETAIDPTIFSIPLMHAQALARDFASSVISRRPPVTLSNESDRIPPLFVSLNPPALPAKRPYEQDGNSSNQRQRHDNNNNRTGNYQGRNNNGSGNGTGNGSATQNNNGSTSGSPAQNNRNNGQNGSSNGGNGGSGGNNNNNRTTKVSSTGLRIVPKDPANPPSSYLCQGTDDCVQDKLICLNYLRGGCKFGTNCFRFHANAMNDIPTDIRTRLQARVREQGYDLQTKNRNSGNGDSGNNGNNGANRSNDTPANGPPR